MNPKPITWFEADNGCWICTGHSRNKPNGYPKKWFRGRQWPVSRIVWTQKLGEIPAGLCVLHRCDTPSCIRIDHLFLGTVADNNADMIAKGRNRYGESFGERHGMHKLTWEQVTRIREDPKSSRLIAFDYGVHKSTICRIKRNKNWKGRV